MKYRLNKQDLMQILGIWNNFFKKNIHLIACGGTALTLLDIKSSTKDVDFIAPVESEYYYLINLLIKLGYKETTGSGWKRDDSYYIFEIYKGKKIHTTQLLESPLEANNHILLKNFSHIYLGILNYYDIIISKLFRGSSVDMEDCLNLVKNKRKEIHIDLLRDRYLKTSLYDISEDRIKKNLDIFLEVLKEEGIYGE